MLKPAKWLRLRCPRHDDFTAVIARDANNLTRCPACRCLIEAVAPPAEGSTAIELPAYFLTDGKRWYWNGKKRQTQNPAQPGFSTEISDSVELTK